MMLQQTPRIIYGYEKYYPVPLSVCSAHPNIGYRADILLRDTKRRASLNFPELSRLTHEWLS